MMADFGLPHGQVADVLSLAGDYIDLGKIAVGTSRLYDLTYLQRKLALYRRHRVRPFIGGQFMEYVYAVYGDAMLSRYLKEAKRVGFDVIEISDNCVPLSSSERMKQIRMAREHGLAVFGEVGSKDMRNDARKLIAQAHDCFDAGAELVLVEAAELVENGRPKLKLISAIRSALDMSKVLIELPGPWITGVTLSAVEDMKKFLVSEFGADVNIANVMPQDVLETEALRVGLGVVGPKVDRRTRVESKTAGKHKGKTRGA